MIKVKKFQDYLIGKIEIPHGSLSSQVEMAYTQLMEVTIDFPFLLSCRNFVPLILKDENGVQRYKIFNEARYRVFKKHNVTLYPSACAVGTHFDSFLLRFVASKTKPNVFENDEQVSAFDYPNQFGTSPPLFSRAVEHDGNVFISGTASIIGYDTVFKGDIIGQTITTLKNINHLIQKIGIEDDFVYVTYLKDVSSFKKVQQMFIDKNIVCKYMVEDLCRDDLLIETEVLPRRIYEKSFM